MQNTKKVLLLLIIFGFLLRFIWISSLVERDEGAFAYVAMRLDSGHILYEDSADNKMPFLYFFYLIAYKLFGNDIFGIRLFNNILYLFSIPVFFYVVKKELGLPKALASTFYFVLLMNLPVLEGQLAMSESIGLPFYIFSFFFFQNYFGKKNITFIIFCGILFSISCLITYKIFFIGLIGYLFYLTVKKLKINITEGYIFVLSFFSLLLLTFFYFYFNRVNLLENIFRQLLIFYITPFSNPMPIEYTLLVFIELAFFILLALLGLIISSISSKSWTTYLFLLLIIPLIHTSPYFGHYYLFLVPILSIYSGYAIIFLLKIKKYLGLFIIFSSVIIISYFTLLHYPDFTVKSDYFEFKLSDFDTRLQQDELSSYILNNTLPGDYIIYWGWEPYLAFRSGRELTYPGMLAMCFIPSIGPKSFLEHIYYKLDDRLSKYKVDKRLFDNFYIRERMKLKLILYLPGYNRYCATDPTYEVFSELRDENSKISFLGVEIYKSKTYLR